MWVYNYISHSGVPGMRWGRRKAVGSTSSGLTKKSKIVIKNNDLKKEVKALRRDRDKMENTLSKQKSIKDMSDVEIKTVVTRLKLEKDFNDLVKAQTPEKSARVSKLVNSIIDKSITTVGTQLAVYALGSAINKTVGQNKKTIIK